MCESTSSCADRTRLTGWRSPIPFLLVEPVVHFVRPRIHVRRFVFTHSLLHSRQLALSSACAFAVVASACASAPSARAPAPVAPTVVAPVVVAPPPTVATWTINASPPGTRYLTEVNATLERDSAGRVLQERVQSRGVITLQTRRDSLGGMRSSGVVDSFTVRGLEAVLATAVQAESRASRPVPVVAIAPLSVQFDATLDARTLRVTTRPPLANECDRAESGATTLVREVMVRVPKVLFVGLQWSDSTVGFMCRLNVPITTRARSVYSVERSEQLSDHVELVLKRVVDTQLDGNLQSAWRTVTLSGIGHSTQSVRVDAATGVVRSIEGDGLLTIKLNDTGRRDGGGAQELRQKTTSRTIVRP